LNSLQKPSLGCLSGRQMTFCMSPGDVAEGHAVVPPVVDGLA
jgi:hypothetical protein